jgi:hypothetical protein
MSNLIILYSAAVLPLKDRALFPPLQMLGTAGHTFYLPLPTIFETNVETHNHDFEAPMPSWVFFARNTIETEIPGRQICF